MRRHMVGDLPCQAVDDNQLASSYTYEVMTTEARSTPMQKMLTALL